MNQLAQSVSSELSADKRARSICHIGSEDDSPPNITVLLSSGRALCISRACTITWGINSTPELFPDFIRCLSHVLQALSFLTHKFHV